MPCKYLKKGHCNLENFIPYSHSAFVKMMKERFFQSSEITLRNIFNSRLEFGLINRCLRLNIWGHVLIGNAFSQVHISLLATLKLAVLKATLERVSCLELTAHPMNALTGPLTLKPLFHLLREVQGAQCPQKWKLLGRKNHLVVALCCQTDGNYAAFCCGHFDSSQLLL